MDMDGTYSFSQSRLLVVEGLSSTIKLYPNRAIKQLNIILQGNSQNNSYELMDALGRVLLIGNLTVHSNTKVNVTALASGTYSIRITTVEKVVTEKIQIVK